MVLRFSPPMALSDACSTARASCAEAVAAVSPSNTTSINSLRIIGPSKNRMRSVPWAYNPRNSEDTRDDDKQVGLLRTRVGAGRMLVAADSRSEYDVPGGA